MASLHAKTKTLKTYGKKRNFRTVNVAEWELQSNEESTESSSSESDEYPTPPSKPALKTEPRKPLSDRSNRGPAERGDKGKAPELESALPEASQKNTIQRTERNEGKVIWRARGDGKASQRRRPHRQAHEKAARDVDAESQPEVVDLTLEEHSNEADTPARALADGVATAPDIAPSAQKCPDRLTGLLATCGQQRPYDFASFIDAVPELVRGPSGRARAKVGGWEKIGEATYSEVYRWSTRTGPSRQTRSAGTSGSDEETTAVMKVIPLRTVDGAVDRSLPVESPCEEVQREIVVGRTLSHLEGFVNMRCAYIVSGGIPTELLDEWDDWKRRFPTKSENLRPSLFTPAQHFCVIVMSDVGVDLESAEIANWSCAVSVLYQVTSALAAAEREHRFEHRDLHIGNVAIRPRQAPSIDDLMAGISLREQTSPDHILDAINSSAPVASILDFTLSRLDGTDGEVIWTRPEDAILQATGKDPQYEVYNKMGKVFKDWSAFRPETNVWWLQYLAAKLLNEKGLPRPSPEGGSGDAEETACFELLTRAEKLLRRGTSAAAFLDDLDFEARRLLA